MALPHEQVYARIHISPIHGVGVFAIRDIPEGTYMFANDDGAIVWVNATALSDIDPELKKFYDDFCMLKGGRYGCPENFNKLTAAWYLNDSKTPNVASDADYAFYALRDIAKGEELLVDYDTFSDKPLDQ